jgi:hypothetical protein
LRPDSKRRDTDAAAKGVVTSGVAGRALRHETSHDFGAAYAVDEV